jgi:hypothetical protein
MSTSEDDIGKLRDIRADKFSSDTTKFLLSLAKESERSAVVLGVARLDNSLEKLLKSYMHYCIGENDNLFDSDKPLSFFSSKIALAYRLGLIDGDFEHALQMARRIRNEFAHAIEVSSLKDSPNRERLYELIRAVEKDIDYPHVRELFSQIENPLLLDFCSSIGLLIVTIGIGELFGKPFTPYNKCDFDK